MKNLMKLFKALFVVLIAIIGIKTIDVKAETTAPSTITMGIHESFDDYIGNLSTSFKQTKKGTVVYCTEYLKLAPSTGTILNKKSTMDAGIAYIINNGYPAKKFTGNNYKDYYITQLAMWWYIDIANGKTTKGLEKLEDGKTYKNNSYYNYVVSLKDGAVKAAKAGFTSPSISINVSSKKLTISSDGKYYVTSEISAKEVAIKGKYSVTLNNAPSGTIITNTSGTKATSFSSSDKFIVKVPVSSVSKSLSFSITVKASGEINKPQVYSVVDNSYQKLVVAKLYPETKSVSKKVTFSVTPDKILVNKIDKTTKEAVTGATLAVKNSSGKVIETWVSKKEAHTLTNLPNGTYTVYEVKAPDGYKLSSKTYSFTISNSGSTKTVNVLNVKYGNDKVNIYKTDSGSGKKIAGAKLAIKDSKGNVVKTWTTTTEIKTFSDLADGDYILYEESAPEGYKKTTKTFPFTIVNEEQSININVQNTKYENDEVVINKVDSVTGKQVAGAKLAIKDSTGKVVKTFVTTEYPESISDLAKGKYTVYEVSAPEGYEKTNAVKSFEIVNKEKEVNITIENVKLPEKTKVKISKLDITNSKELPGATLTVKDSNGNVIDTWVSGNEAHYLELVDGTYTLTEVSQPKGYELNEETITFEVENNKTVVEVIMYNTPIEEVVEVEKTGVNSGLFYGITSAVTFLGLGLVRKYGKENK